MAAEIPTGAMHGGDQVNTYLRRRGFSVVRLNKEERAYWKVSAGEFGKLWPEFHARSQIAVGFLKDWEGDASGFESYDELLREIKSQGKVGKTAKYLADQLWWFVSDMRPGDQVVIYNNKKIFGIGEITGPYTFVSTPDGLVYPHRRSVKWIHTEPCPTTGIDPDLQTKLSLYQTLNELTESEFEEIIRIVEKRPPPPPDPFASLMAHLSACNLYFSPETVANYLLSLQSKRFVILTGISGTGKTRLAMAVAEFFRPTVKIKRAADIPVGSLQVEVFPYMLKYRKLTLPVELGFQLLAEAPGFPNVTVRYPDGKASLRCWKDPNRNVTELNLSGSFREWFNQQFKPGDLFLLRTAETQSGESARHQRPLPRLRKKAPLEPLSSPPQIFLLPAV